MDLDNPSYFSVASGSSTPTQPSFGFFKCPTRMGNADSASSSSESSLTRQSTASRRPGRTFLRSVSSASADSNQELLILGEPRLCDIAPDIAFKTRRSNSLKSPKQQGFDWKCGASEEAGGAYGDDAQESVFKARSSNSLRSPKHQAVDWRYSPLPTSEEAPGAGAPHGEDPRETAIKSLRGNPKQQGFDWRYTPLPASETAPGAGGARGDGVREIAISDDCARYYNFSAMRTEQRRHSIGAFAMRERTVSVASSTRSCKDGADQGKVPEFDDHSLRHGSYPRKRCSRCTRGVPTRNAHMDDILIVSLKLSQAANLWVEYFTSYFQQISKQANRQPFKVKHIGAEDVTNANGDVKLLAETTVGVKLQLVVVCPGFLEHISENPETSCGLGKLLLPDRTLALLLGVTDDNLTEVHKKALPTYSQWQRFAVGQDQDANFTKEFLAHAMAIFSRIWKQQSSVLAHEKPQFSVLPKKIRQGQNSVVIMLTHPLQKEDVVKVSIEKNDELIEIKPIKRRNPYTIKLSVPASLTEVSAIVNVVVEKNGHIIGSRPIKCESRLRELEQILRSSNNAVEFLCQTLGFGPAEKENLDNWMAHIFQKNIPPHFNLLNSHGTTNPILHSHRHSHEEYPTLLHFAARFGLEKLAMQLLDSPGGEIAYDIRNACDLTPAEIAENSGHTDLANILRGYMKMNEFSCVYSKLKEMSLNTYYNDREAAEVTDEEGYLAPNMVSELYKICPPPRPVNPLGSSSAQISLGYMTMSNSTGKLSSSLSCPNSASSDMDPPLQKPTTPTPNETKPLPSPNLEKPPKNPSPSPSVSTTHPKNEVCEDKVQRELLEIINDFKNNVHSISQVEKLVEEWKNRNDVQKSFQEKQEQLNEMRMKYERIQQDMKNSMKKPTPFDRVKKLFSRGKSREDKSEISSPVTSSNPNLMVVSGQRPISSLSLQSTSSSGSSGRMSTISGCSLGDSGTQSDPEERKQILSSHQNEDDFRNELNRVVMNLNYQIVPAPKPVKPNSFSNRSKTFETIEEKPSNMAVSDGLNEEHYILFPPSGLPVPGMEHLLQDEDTASNRTTQNLYINMLAPQTNDKTANECHDYMNVADPGQNIHKT